MIRCQRVSMVAGAADSRVRSIFAALACAWLAQTGLGCQSPGLPGSPPGEDAAVEEGVTYHHHIRPIIERACIKCHHQGGATPFPLESWDDVGPRAFRVADAVLSRTMPPAQVDPSCRPVVGGNWIPEAEYQLFAEWLDGGLRQGDPAHYVQPPPLPPEEDLGPPDIVFRLPEPYTPTWNENGEDFPMLDFDYVVPERLYVRATRVVPTAPEIAHHMLVGPWWIDEHWFLEDATDGSVDGSVAGYVPGQPMFRLPPGTAFVLPEGTTFGLFAHYHRGALAPDAPTPADQAEVHLWTMPAEEVTQRARLRGVYYWDLFIEAEDSESVQEGVVALGESPAVQFAAVPHMHLLGTSIRLQINHLDGSTECVVHEPYYSFDWQLLHRFPQESFIELQGGETATITCIYDNSQENQPYINGTQVRTQDVTAGPSSTDEMCQVFLFEAVPFTP
jgi:hypothetical protein